ncbi:MAG: hypothetical protein K8S14_09540 [Actinomycetia bacterium]|nr:hypothetical protein [Actinomycetes bacterium]
MTVNPGERLKNYIYTKKDKKILRELAMEKTEIASSEINQEKIKMWKALNELKEMRPMVLLNDVCWHEMNVDDKLTLKTSTEFTRRLETILRKTNYWWHYMRTDMVVESTIPCYFEVENTGFGISEIAENITKTDPDSDIAFRAFTSQIKNEEDIEKIKTPRVTYHEDDTNNKFQAMVDIFDGIAEVKKMGYPGVYFAPWDDLVAWWDVQTLLTDMMIRPDLVHMAMDRLTEACLKQLDQFEDLNLLSLNNRNYFTGSGGLGYTDELPQKDFDQNKIIAKDLWGNCAAQLLAGVSPEMHEEFALQYEIKYMKRFGLTYYGCCEPLEKKIDILRKIPNLRKISMSPWVDLELGAANIGKDYVFSYKPNPVIFTGKDWDPELIRKRLFEDLKKLKGCNVEILMKDISTVQYKPHRLWEWAKIASEVVNKI